MGMGWQIKELCNGSHSLIAENNLILSSGAAPKNVKYKNFMMEILFFSQPTFMVSHPKSGPLFLSLSLSTSTPSIEKQEKSYEPRAIHTYFFNVDKSMGKLPRPPLV